jgi:hypothetical protein
MAVIHHKKISTKRQWMFLPSESLQATFSMGYERQEAESREHGNVQQPQ